MTPEQGTEIIRLLDVFLGAIFFAVIVFSPRSPS